MSASAFENATQFFHACESLKGWQGCQPFVAAGAKFVAQCEPLVDIETVESYVEWMAGLGKNVLPGCRYRLRASAFDDSTRQAVFFATLTATHAGLGGPVPPTRKTAVADYVYVLEMNSDNKVANMIKVWNAPWTLKELGWA